MDERGYSEVYDPTRSRLAVSGSVADGAVERLGAAVARCSGELTQDLQVDLTDVDFLPSAAIEVLAVAMRDAGARDTRIELVSRERSLASRVLEICGLPFTRV